MDSVCVSFYWFSFFFFLFWFVCLLCLSTFCFFEGENMKLHECGGVVQEDLGKAGREKRASHRIVSRTKCEALYSHFWAVLLVNYIITCIIRPHCKGLFWRDWIKLWKVGRASNHVDSCSRWSNDKQKMKGIKEKSVGLGRLWERGVS